MFGINVIWRRHEPCLCIFTSLDWRRSFCSRRYRNTIYFSDFNLNIHEMKRTRTMVSRLGPRLFPCLPYVNGGKFLCAAVHSKSLWRLICSCLKVDHDLQQNYVLRLFDVFFNSVCVFVFLVIYANLLNSTPNCRSALTVLSVFVYKLIVKYMMKETMYSCFNLSLKNALTDHFVLEQRSW